jgi:hypothetical protein
MDLDATLPVLSEICGELVCSGTLAEPILTVFEKLLISLDRHCELWRAAMEVGEMRSAWSWSNFTFGVHEKCPPDDTGSDQQISANALIQ